MSTNIKDLIPQSKYDVVRTQAAIEAGYPTVAPILPDLLDWLQDMNWPVAKPLAPFLASVGEPLIPHIRYILEANDDIWKYWVLSSVVAESPVIANAFPPELERFVSLPTKNECAEDLHEISQEILEKLNNFN